MPNWSYLFTNLLLHLGLALWVGGTLVLGALVAPGLFRALPRAQAGAIFGPTLRRFARVRLGALIAIVLAAAIKFAAWEHNANVWIAVRWIAIAFMAASLVYEIAVLEKALEARRVHLTPEMGEEDPTRRAFQSLHRRAERLLQASLVAALVVMLLS